MSTEKVKEPAAELKIAEPTPEPTPEDVAPEVTPEVIPRRGMVITTDGTVAGTRIEQNGLNQLEILMVAQLLQNAK